MSVDPGPDRPGGGAIDLVVVGAHLSGMPLNRELTALGAALQGETATAPEYRLFELDGTQPTKPGLLRVGAAQGRRIAVEVWRMTPTAFGLFVQAVPPPLSIGTVRLEDGRGLKGFLVEALAVENARDISEFGGWRAYRAGAAAG